MMDVANETVKRLAFMEVLELVAAGNDRALEQAGLSKEAIARIRKAGAKDVPDLSRMLNVVVSVDTRKLNMKFSRAEIAIEEQRSLEYFITNHATPAMIQRYFRTLSKRSIQQLRAMHKTRKTGRTPVLDNATAFSVFTAWAKLSVQVPDERQRYMVLHQDFSEWPLSSLYSAINEADEVEK